MKALIPEYFQSFKCIGGECEDTCCRGWNVDIDKKSYQKYKKVMHPDLKNILKENMKRNRKSANDLTYASFKMGSNGICNMADENGLCTIQSVLGEESLCKTCAIYPRSFNMVDGTLEKSLDFSCPEAARLGLLNSKGIDFLEIEDFTNENIEVFSTKENSIFWPLRIFTIEIMQTQIYSIEARLILLGLFLDKIQHLEKKTLENVLLEIENYKIRLNNAEYMKRLDNIQSNDMISLVIMSNVLEINSELGISNARYRLIVADVIKGLDLGSNIQKTKLRKNYAKENYYDEYIKEKAYIFENYIVNYIFKNLFPYNGLDFMESYAKLVIDFAMIKLYLHGLAIVNERLDDVITIACIQSYVKSNMHNKYFKNRVINALKENEMYSYNHLYALIQA